MITNNTIQQNEKLQKILLKLTFKIFITVLNNIHSRWVRKPFSNSLLWEIISTNNETNIILFKKRNKNYYNINININNCILEIKQRINFGELIFKSIPWCISFYDRMNIIREWLDTERIKIQGGAGATNNIFMQVNDINGERSHGITIKIRHSNLLADGITAMNKINGSDIKDRIVVRYINNFGIEEMVFIIIIII